MVGFENDTKRARACENNKNKEKSIAQFVADSKSSTLVTKNRNLRTVYRMQFDDNDDDKSDFTANF